MCSLLGLALNDKQIDALCRKHGLHKGKEPLDPAYGFYLLHRVCHLKGGAVAKRITKLLDERFAGIVRMVRKARLSGEPSSGNDLRIATMFDPWLQKSPAGVLWALLSDPRERFQQHGFYLVHKVSYAAFRDAERKTTAPQQDAGELATLERNLALSRKSVAQQKAEAEDLRNRLDAAEKSAATLEATCHRQEQQIAELQERPDRETRLRRRIRMLEHELTQLRQEAPPDPKAAADEPNDQQQASGQPLETAVPCCHHENGDTRPFDPAASSETECGPCPLDSLRVAVIGGLDRLEPHYRRAVEALGAEFLFHNGDCHPGSRVLKSVVCQSDIIVFITRLNSHSALQVVRGLCRKSGRRFTAIRETSPTALARALQEVA
jgi:hypothetical protein